MKIGIVVYSNDPETAWNAFRYANLALKEGDQVKVFLTGRGVEAESLDADKFGVTEQMKAILAVGGTIMACSTCLKLRSLSPTEVCPFARLKDMHAMVRDSDRILTF